MSKYERTDPKIVKIMEMLIKLYPESTITLLIGTPDTANERMGVLHVANVSPEMSAMIVGPWAENTLKDREGGNA